MTDIDEGFFLRLTHWARSLPSDRGSGSVTKLGMSDPPSLTGLDDISSEGFLRAQEAWTVARDLWRDEDDAFEFLTRKHAMLDDQRPIVFALESGDGLRSVVSIIERLRFGSAA